MDAAQTSGQSLKTKPLGPHIASQAQHDLPADIDRSIFNPLVFVVEPPDHVSWRTPPVAPRAILDQTRSVNIPRWSSRPWRGSSATVPTRHWGVWSNQATKIRAHGHPTTTMGSHNSLECKLPDRDDCAEQGKSRLKSELTHSPPLPRSSVAQNHSSTGKDTAVAHQSINAPASKVKQPYKPARSNPPPPGFEPIQASAPAYQVPRLLAFENSVVDFIDTTGTYCYSKIWVSEEERMRINFKRAKERAHRNDFDKSPFFPQNVAEYTALVAEKEATEEATEVERICKKSVQGLCDEVKMNTAAASLMQLQHLSALKTRDGLSAVLAADTCFNEAPNAPEDDRVDWPPDSEFRSWKECRPPPGNDLRKKAYRGAWPFPRINKPFQAGETFEDGEVPYGKRQIVLAPRWDCAPKSIWVQDERFERAACDIEMGWLSDANPMLADLLEDI